MAIKKVSNLDFVDGDLRLFESNFNLNNLVVNTNDSTKYGISSIVAVGGDTQANYAHALFEISYPGNLREYGIHNMNTVDTLYTSNKMTYQRLLLSSIAPDIKAILNVTNGLIDDNLDDISLNQIANKDFILSGNKTFLNDIRVHGNLYINNANNTTYMDIAHIGELYIDNLKVGNIISSKTNNTTIHKYDGYTATPSAWVSWIGAFDNTNYPTGKSDEENTTFNIVPDGNIQVLNNLNLNQNHITATNATLKGTLTVANKTQLSDSLNVANGKSTTLGGNLTTEGTSILCSNVIIGKDDKQGGYLKVVGIDRSPSSWGCGLYVGSHEGGNGWHGHPIAVGTISCDNGIYISGGDESRFNTNIVVTNGKSTTLGGTLTVTDVTQLNNTLNVDNGKSTTLGGTLTVTGATQLNNTLNVDNGKSTTLGGTLTVTGVTTIKSDLCVVNGTTRKDIHCNELYGTAQKARWADLAECYESDKEYEPGTLIQFGGNKEVTIATTEVNAVVSTKPGVLLNSFDNVESDKTMLQIAMIGRVPVKVDGNVKKHDKIYLSIKQRGIATSNIEDSVGDPIGRALEDKKNDSDLVECVVKLRI